MMGALQGGVALADMTAGALCLVQGAESFGVGWRLRQAGLVVQGAGEALFRAPSWTLESYSPFVSLSPPQGGGVGYFSSMGR